MFFNVMYFLCVAAEFVAVPIFLKYYWPTKCKESFIWKTVAATLFVLAGFFAMKASGNNTPYADMMMWGLVFGLMGDLLLHALTKVMWPFVLGVVSFLTGHIFYIIAIQKAIKTTYPDSSVFEWYELLAIVLIVAVTICYLLIRNIVKKDNIPMLAGLSAYLVILTTMLVKAFRYVIGEWSYGTNDHMVMVVITVAVGALLFFISDVTLGLIILNKERFETRPMRIFNITTYFVAQILLASSIYFVHSFEIFGA